MLTWLMPHRRTALKALGTAAIVPVSALPVSGKGKKGDHRIRGRIVRPDGEPGSRDRIIIEPLPHATGGDNQFDTTNGGSFVAAVDPDDKAADPAFDEGEYAVGYYRIPPDDNATGIVRDGNPDIANLGIVDASRGVGNLGTVRLAEAHVLDVEVVDDDGNPVSDVRVRVGHGGYGTDGRTNRDGLLQFDGANVTGIELPATDESGHRVSVSVGPSIGPPEPPERFDLTDDRTVLFDESGELVD